MATGADKKIENLALVEARKLVKSKIFDYDLAISRVEIEERNATLLTKEGIAIVKRARELIALNEAMISNLKPSDDIEDLAKLEGIYRVYKKLTEKINILLQENEELKTKPERKTISLKGAQVPTPDPTTQKIAMEELVKKLTGVKHPATDPNKAVAHFNLSQAKFENDKITNIQINDINGNLIDNVLLTVHHNKSIDVSATSADFKDAGKALQIAEAMVAAAKVNGLGANTKLVISTDAKGLVFNAILAVAIKKGNDLNILIEGDQTYVDARIKDIQKLIESQTSLDELDVLKTSLSTHLTFNDPSKLDEVNKIWETARDHLKAKAIAPSQGLNQIKDWNKPANDARFIQKPHASTAILLIEQFVTEFDKKPQDLNTIKIANDQFTHFINHSTLDSIVKPLREAWLANNSSLEGKAGDEKFDNLVKSITTLISKVTELAVAKTEADAKAAAEAKTAADAKAAANEKAAALLQSLIDAADAKNSIEANGLEAKNVIKDAQNTACQAIISAKIDNRTTPEAMKVIIGAVDAAIDNVNAAVEIAMIAIDEAKTAAHTSIDKTTFGTKPNTDAVRAIVDTAKTTATTIINTAKRAIETIEHDAAKAQANFIAVERTKADDAASKANKSVVEAAKTAFARIASTKNAAMRGATPEALAAIKSAVHTVGHNVKDTAKQGLKHIKDQKIATIASINSGVAMPDAARDFGELVTKIVSDIAIAADERIITNIAEAYAPSFRGRSINLHMWPPFLTISAKKVDGPGDIQPDYQS
ncbi:MAG: hypothetical protein Q7V63_03420 [Gammaproteobacteria bacterium]|nr:hypothetical protein [Gammaproteobacteria bacterium]